MDCLNLKKQIFQIFEIDSIEKNDQHFKLKIQ